MKTLLVPTDFSKASLNAFQHAIKLARLIDAHIKVVHIHPQLQDFSDDNTSIVFAPPIAAKNAVSKHLNTFIAQGKTSKMVKTPIHTEGYDYSGQAAEKIVSLSKSSDIDLLVMGATGETGDTQKTFGSVSRYAAEAAYCPVLLIPEGIRFRKPKNILFACDMDMSLNSAILYRLAFIANCLGSKVHVLHINTKKGDIDTHQMAKCEWNLVESERFSFKSTINKEKNIQRALDTYATHNHIDLMVLSSQHQQLFQKIVHENVLEQWAIDKRLPLLILHREDKFSMF